MRSTILNLVALALVACGGGHLLAQTTSPVTEPDEAGVCCMSATKKARCCGETLCRAGHDRCCSDDGCEAW